MKIGQEVTFYDRVGGSPQKATVLEIGDPGPSRAKTLILEVGDDKVKWDNVPHGNDAGEDSAFWLLTTEQPPVAEPVGEVRASRKKK